MLATAQLTVADKQNDRASFEEETEWVLVAIVGYSVTLEKMQSMRFALQSAV
jgi:hypothetical protein